MPIIKSNVTQQVTDYLKEHIDNKSWQVGDKIPSENQLTALLNVSRASVRMAIQQLIGIGCLKSIHGKGTFVISSDLTAVGGNKQGITAEDCQNLNEVLEYRLIVETGCCYLAAQRATLQNIETLSEYLTIMKNNVGKAEIFVKYDVLFHEEVCKAAGNPLLIKSLSEVFEQNMQKHKLLNQLFGYTDGIYYHSQILKAIRERNPNKAKKLMQEHISKAIGQIEN